MTKLTCTSLHKLKKHQIRLRCSKVFLDFPYDFLDFAREKPRTTTWNIENDEKWKKQRFFRCSPGSMSSLFGDFFGECWPDWFAFCDKISGQVFGQISLGPENTVYSSTGTEKYIAQYNPDRESKLFTIRNPNITNSFSGALTISNNFNYFGGAALRGRPH